MPRPVDVTIQGKDNTKPAVDSAEKRFATFGERVKSSILNPLNVVKGVVATVIASSVASFARASVESAAAADAAWGRVEQSVRNVGANFDVVRGSLDRVFTRIQETTRFSDDDAADAFATLVRMSGDYTGSLQQLSLVTDVAAAKKMDLASAAELVGKVMAGEEGGLKRVGVVLREGESGMEGLRRQFTGFAERDAGTLQGQLARIANAWDNVKEAVGRALTSVDDTGKTTNVVAEGLNNLGKWIDDNRSGIQELVQSLADLLGLLARVAAWTLPDGKKNDGPAWKEPFMPILRAVSQKTGVPLPAVEKQDRTREARELAEFQQQHAENVKARDEKLAQAERDKAARAANDQKRATERAKEAEQAQGKRIAQLKNEYELTLAIGRLAVLDKPTDAAAIKKAEEEKLARMGRQLAIEREMLAIARDRNQSLANRATAADFVADRRAEEQRMLAGIDDVMRTPPKLAFTRSRVSLPVEVKMPAAPVVPTAPAPRGFGDDVAASLTDAFGGEDAFAGIEASLGSLDARVKDFTGNTLASMFTVWSDGIDDVISQHNVLGRVVPALMRKAVGAALHADAQDTMLRAAKALALALTDPSGVHAMQAAKLFAVGSAELAAASALSGGGRGGSFGGGGVSAGGFSQVQSDIGGRGKVTVVIPRARGSYAPDELEALAAAIQELDQSRDIEFIYKDRD